LQNAICITCKVHLREESNCPVVAPLFKLEIVFLSTGHVHDAIGLREGAVCDGHGDLLVADIVVDVIVEPIEVGGIPLDDHTVLDDSNIAPDLVLSRLGDVSVNIEPERFLC